MKQHSQIIKEVAKQTGIDELRVKLAINYLTKGIKKLLKKNKKININGFATFYYKKNKSKQLKK